MADYEHIVLIHIMHFVYNWRAI